MRVPRRFRLRSPKAWCLAAGVLAYAVLVYRTAWMSDDAFISMRTVSNLLSGYGLTWNPGERVQAFTHPLWMLGLIGAHAASGEPFYSVLLLSWLVSCLGVAWLVLSSTGGFAERLLSLVLVCSSKAFVEYSSSGLENPLTHLLLAAFATSYLAPGARPPLQRLALLAGLAALNRLDTALLYAPALVAAVVRSGARKSLPALLIGATPLLLWELFSLAYYGFALPNTAYAKLAAGEFVGLERALEALHYFMTSWQQDPLTLGTLALCTLVAILRRDAPRLFLLSGALLYLVYVVRIGGDFMAGRFFSAPFFVGVCCLATSSWLSDRSSALVSGWTALVVFVSLGDTPPALTGAGYAPSAANPAINSYGIHDERLAFFQCDSLTNAWRMNPTHADHPWTQQAQRIRELAARDPTQRVHIVDAIGHAGYYAGPTLHLVDRWALSDPLLARLPALFGTYGHMAHVLPAGYLETLRTGENRIADKSLAAYYDDLRRVVRGPLFDAQRLAAIARLNLGIDDHLLREYAYVQSNALRVQLHLTNPTSASEVMVYSWNEGDNTSYILDSASHQGKSYEIVWSLTAAGPRLENAGAVPLQQAHRLHPHGVFTLSVALSAQHGASHSDIYELRYDYRLQGKTITALRDAWPAWVHDFPTGFWHDEAISHVMTVTSLTARP